MYAICICIEGLMNITLSFGTCKFKKQGLDVDRVIIHSDYVQVKIPSKPMKTVHKLF